MSMLLKALAAGALMLAATPCLALTTTTPPVNQQDRTRFSDPDEALAAVGSSFRDSMIDSHLRAQGAGFIGSGAPSMSSAPIFGFGPLTASAQTYDRSPAFGYGAQAAAPGLPPSPAFGDRRR